MMVAWLFFYFLRDDPLVVFGRTIDDRVVLIILGVLTIVFLFLTHATLNIVVALVIGGAFVVVHGTVRKTDDLVVADEETTGLMASNGGSGPGVTGVPYSTSVVAFATFFDHQSAIAALHALNGVSFDPETGSTLHIKLARSNSRIKHKPGNGPYIVIDRRTQAIANPRETYQVTAVTVKLVNAVKKTILPTKMIQWLQPVRWQLTQATQLQIYPGFNMVKLHARGGMPVAFIREGRIVRMITIFCWFNKLALGSWEAMIKGVQNRSDSVSRTTNS
ncbi:hypothetical protein ACFE04_004024 [Oxalis oulophora]